MSRPLWVFRFGLPFCPLRLPNKRSHVWRRWGAGVPILLCMCPVTRAVHWSSRPEWPGTGQAQASQEFLFHYELRTVSLKSESRCLGPGHLCSPVQEVGQSSQLGERSLHGQS